MNRPIIILLLLGISVLSFGQDKWDLRRCVDYALENNITIKQQDIQAKISELTYKQSDLSRYPSFNFSTNLSMNTGRSIDRTTNLYTTQSVINNYFSLQSNLDLFNFFSKTNTIAGNKLEAEAASATVQKVKDDISLNVAAAFLQALLAKEQVNASKIQIDLTTAQLENTRKQVRAGSLPELNQLQIESQLANDSSTLISAVGTETQSMLLLKALLNIDAGMPFDIEAPPIDLIPVDPIAEMQPEAVYLLAMKNLPQQRVNQLRLDAARKFAAAAKGAMYPSIGVGFSLGSNYSNLKSNPSLISATPTGLDTIGHVYGSNVPVVVPLYDKIFRVDASPYWTQISDNFSNAVGFGVNIPIFNGGSARIYWQKQKLNVQNLTLQQELDNKTLKQDIYQAYTDATTALQKFNASTKAVETAQKAYDFSSKRYTVGLLNTIELLISQNNLFRAKIDRLSAQYTYVFKMKVLEYYKGQGIKL
jgi:outer membrane protein